MDAWKVLPRLLNWEKKHGNFIETANKRTNDLQMIQILRKLEPSFETFFLCKETLKKKILCT